MINKNDLYDITFALIIVRNGICEKTNVSVLAQIIEVLRAESNTEDNQIRKALASVEGIERDSWSFAFHNNVYVTHQLLKNKDIYSLLIKLLQGLIRELNNNEFEKAYDLIDSFHCLPEIIADNNFTIPKSFWKTFVKDYRRKWDSGFLRAEQRNTKRYQ